MNASVSRFAPDVLSCHARHAGMYSLNHWIPACAGMTAGWIPACAGMTAGWIPAFAGMTAGWIPAFAGMTVEAGFRLSPGSYV